MSHYDVPLWAQLVVAVLLLASALFTLTAVIGVLRLKNFYQRMHPPALIVTWGAWCVTFASMLYFSLHSGQLQLHAWIIIILLSITVPITTVLLSRAALFRGRRQPGGEQLPPPLQPLSQSDQKPPPA